MNILLTENSLYTNDEEKSELLKDKHKLSSLLIINYFGFLSMYSAAIKDRIRKYKSEEQDINIKNISDDNLDVSLSIKLAVDGDLNIPAATVKKMTMLLRDIKSGVINKSKHIDNDLVHQLFKECKFDTTNKPDSILMPAVNLIANKDIPIQWYAYEFWKVCKNPKIKDIAQEFVTHYKLGRYQALYNYSRNGEFSLHDGTPEHLIKKTTETSVKYDKNKESVGKVHHTADLKKKGESIKSFNDFLAVSKSSDTKKSAITDVTYEPDKEDPFQTDLKNRKPLIISKILGTGVNVKLTNDYEVIVDSKYSNNIKYILKSALDPLHKESVNTEIKFNKNNYKTKFRELKNIDVNKFIIENIYSVTKKLLADKSLIKKGQDFYTSDSMTISIHKDQNKLVDGLIIDIKSINDLDRSISSIIGGDQNITIESTDRFFVNIFVNNVTRITSSLANIINIDSNTLAIDTIKADFETKKKINNGFKYAEVDKVFEHSKTKISTYKFKRYISLDGYDFDAYKVLVDAKLGLPVIKLDKQPNVIAVLDSKDYFETVGTLLKFDINQFIIDKFIDSFNASQSLYRFNKTANVYETENVKVTFAIVDFRIKGLSIHINKKLPAKLVNLLRSNENIRVKEFETEETRVSYIIDKDGSIDEYMIESILDFANGYNNEVPIHRDEFVKQRNIKQFVTKTGIRFKADYDHNVIMFNMNPEDDDKQSQPIPIHYMIEGLVKTPFTYYEHTRYYSIKTDDIESLIKEIEKLDLNQMIIDATCKEFNSYSVAFKLDPTKLEQYSDANTSIKFESSNGIYIDSLVMKSTRLTYKYFLSHYAAGLIPNRMYLGPKPELSEVGSEVTVRYFVQYNGIIDLDGFQRNLNTAGVIEVDTHNLR